MKKHKPTILFVIAELTNGGIQTQVLHLSIYLKNELNLDVTIWGVKNYQKGFISRLNMAGIKYEMHPEILEFNSNTYHQLSILQKAIKWYKLVELIRKGRFEAIFPYSEPIDKVVNVIWRFTKAKVSFRFERGGNDNPHKIKLNLYQWIAKKSNPTYISNSEHGRLSLSIKYNISKQKIKVIPNAFIEAQNIPIEEAWEVNIPKYKNSIVVTMLANFYNEKDQLTVIEAWAKINKTGNSILIFAGMGEEDFCKQNMNIAKKMVQELEIDNSVHFIGSISNVNKLLNVTNIGILSSISEGCPNAVLEYMGAGLPVIGTDIPGIREVLPIKQHNFLFPTGDIEKCAKIIKQMLDNEDTRLLIGRNNKFHVQNYFAPEKAFHAYKEILKNYIPL